MVELELYDNSIVTCETVLDYITINKDLKGESKLLIGMCDEDGNYTPLNRDELEWHLIGKCWEEDANKYSESFYMRIKRGQS